MSFQINFTNSIHFNCSTLRHSNYFPSHQYVVNYLFVKISFGALDTFEDEFVTRTFVGTTFPRKIIPFARILFRLVGLVLLISFIKTFLHSYHDGKNSNVSNHWCVQFVLPEKYLPRVLLAMGIIQSYPIQIRQQMVFILQHKGSNKLFN